MSRPYAGYGVARIIDLRYPDEGLPRDGQLLAHHFADDPNVYRSIPLPRWQATEPETMLTLLRHLDRRYGGAGPYLKSHGVDDAQLSALRERLTSAP